MKLDQETLVKQHFWFLLGGVLLFWIVALPLEIMSGGKSVGDAQKAYEDQKKAVQGAPRINTGTFLPPWEDAAAQFNGHKSTIWKDAWNYQAGMYDWPQAWRNKDMTNPQTPLSHEDRSAYRNRWYPDEVKIVRQNAPSWIYPVEMVGGFDRVFKPQEWEKLPTREEIWLVQEDFWVKRELFYDIYKTMSFLAYMPRLPIEDKKSLPQGVVARYRYGNQNWDLTLHLRKNKSGQIVIGGDSTITNVNPSRRPQTLTSAKGTGIIFNVVQDQVRSSFEVRGEPVGWNETRAFSMGKDYEPLSGINWERMEERPITVSQGFDRTNSPIRALRAIALAKQDCRTFHWRLQPNQVLAQLDAPAEGENAEAEANADAGSPMMPSGPPAGGSPADMQKMMMPGQGNAKPAGNPTLNNEIERNRYLRPPEQDKDANPPSRHLPLAVRLVVEQSHMNDVQLALANSRLRIQITQVEFHHAKDYRPQSEGDNKDGADKDGYGRYFMGGMPSMSGGPTEAQMRMQMQMQRNMQMGNRNADNAMQMQKQMQMEMQRAMGRGGPGMGRGRGTAMPGGMMGGPPPMMSMPPMPGKGKGAFRPAMPSGMLMPGLPQTSGKDGGKSAAQDQYDDNLVDVTIYGIATLYRRPDPPKAEEQADQLGQPAVPPPPAGNNP